MKKMKLFTALCFTLALANANAQADSNQETHTIGITIPAVALVDVEGGTNIDLTFAAPTEAGLPIAAPTDNNSLWLNYSYIPSIGKTTSKITVSIDPVIPGIDLKVIAAADNGNGGGTTGTPASIVTLTGAPGTDFITGIGASYTGTGNVGHNLTYSAVAAGSATYDDLIEVAAASNQTTVTYTIVEN